MENFGSVERGKKQSIFCKLRPWVVLILIFVRLVDDDFGSLS